jgi:hypothetical protein
VGDAPGAWAHDDQAGGQEKGFFYRVGNKEHHLVGFDPSVQEDFLHRLAGKGV